MNERKHHAYSPSSLQNLEACPCYRNRDTSHVKAITGTLQHSVTESKTDNQKLSDDEALHAAECLDFYERQRRLFLDEWQRECEKSGPVQPIEDICEAYLPVDDCKFEDVASQDTAVTVEATTAGYVDRALVSWNRKRAVLLDWKFGAWAVEQADNNLQGISYSLGLFRKYPELEEVTFYFKQPQLNLITHATFTRAQVPSLYLRVQTVVARAREARKKIILRDNWDMANPMVPVCNFCANIGKCPKVLEFACKVGSKFDPIGIPSDITPTGMKSATDTTLGLRLAQVMEIWAGAFKRQINERVIRRAMPVPPGYILQTRQDREIADAGKFKDVTLKFLTRDELDPLAEYGFGKVEEAIKEKAPRGSKKGTIETYQKELLDSGAVKLGDPYTFLRVASSKDKVEKEA